MKMALTIPPAADNNMQVRKTPALRLVPGVRDLRWAVPALFEHHIVTDDQVGAVREQTNIMRSKES
jgi:hypothetical protein